MILGFYFAHGKGLTGLKLLVSLDAYQITKYQFFQKLVILLLDFRRIRERVSESGILGPIA